MKLPSVLAGNHRDRKRLLLAFASVAAGISILAAAPAGAHSSSGQPPRPSPGLPYGMSALTYHRMLAQVPLDRAAGAIRRTAARSAQGRQGLVQIVVHDDTSTLTIYWHGKVPGDVRRVLAGLRQRMHVAVRPARYTLAALLHATRIVLRHHHDVTSAGPLNDGSGIQVGISDRLPVKSAAAAQAWSGSPVPVTLSRQPAGRPLSCAVPGSSDNLGAPARCNDYAAFWGGAVVLTRNSSSLYAWCTTGFGVHFSNGTSGILTAGHCLQNFGQSNSTWWNGQNTAELGSSEASPFMGSATTPSHDDGVIFTPGGSGSAYYDGPSINNGDTHNTKIVVGQGGVYPGDWECESGAMGGVLCNLQVWYTNQNKQMWDNDFNQEFYASGLAVAHGGTSGAPIAGDSGGPVFSLAGSTTVTARGILSGRSPYVGDVWFTPMDEVSHDLGVTVNGG
ncbi:MAG TPA: hypothetical protein VF834_19345 [Streptosporangiaceae bacterium]